MSTERKQRGASATVPNGIDVEVALTWKELSQRIERTVAPRYDSVPQGDGQVRIVPRRSDTRK
jgi:hypothetical protein